MPPSPPWLKGRSPAECSRPLPGGAGALPCRGGWGVSPQASPSMPGVWGCPPPIPSLPPGLRGDARPYVVGNPVGEVHSREHVRRHRQTGREVRVAERLGAVEAHLAAARVGAAWIERRPVDARHHHQVLVALEARRQREQHLALVEDVYVL